MDPAPPTKKIRAFIALNTPSDYEAAIAEQQLALKKAAPGGDIKWVDPKNIHLTLRFLGYIEPSAVEPISSALRDATSRMGSLQLRAAGLGCFPNCRNPRVIWIGLEDPTDSLVALQKAVVEATRTFGEPPEERPYKAHLTLARVKHLSKENARSLQAKIEKVKLELPPWMVKDVILYQSHLSQAGPRYEALGRFSLA